MKKIPTVINKCEECPFAFPEGLEPASWRCKKTWHVITIHDYIAIPEWCPLEEGVVVVDCLANLGKALNKAVDNSLFMEAWDKLKISMGTRDLITLYMRKERGRL